MSDNTVQPKAGEKHTTSSCCGGEAAEKAPKPAKAQDQPQDQKTAQKSSCCCK